MEEAPGSFSSTGKKQEFKALLVICSQPKIMNHQGGVGQWPLILDLYKQLHAKTSVISRPA
jgi:hypothetical protein